MHDKSISTGELLLQKLTSHLIWITVQVKERKRQNYQPVFTSGMEETVQDVPDRESEWWAGGALGTGAGQDRLIMPLLRFLQLICEVCCVLSPTCLPL